MGSRSQHCHPARCSTQTVAELNPDCVDDPDEQLDSKDIVSWNSMIAGYAQHGLSVQAIDLFEKMKRQSVKPDAITFLGVLSSCRHAVVVKQGLLYFNLMVDYGVQPELDHYACFVDLLGRAGLLEEAQDFIEKMTISPNAVIWGSLLSSSRLHGSVWIDIQAAKKRYSVLGVLWQACCND